MKVLLAVFFIYVSFGRLPKIPLSFPKIYLLNMLKTLKFDVRNNKDTLKNVSRHSTRTILKILNLSVNCSSSASLFKMPAVLFTRSWCKWGIMQTWRRLNFVSSNFLLGRKYAVFVDFSERVVLLSRQNWCWGRHDIATRFERERRH